MAHDHAHAGHSHDKSHDHSHDHGHSHAHGHHHHGDSKNENRIGIAALLTGGFMGKFFVFGAAVQHQYYWLAAIGVLNAAVAAFYYLNVVRAMFFATTDSEVGSKPVPISIPIQISLLVCVVATLWIGLYPPTLIDWANDASRTLLALVF